MVLTRRLTCLSPAGVIRLAMAFTLVLTLAAPCTAQTADSGVYSVAKYGAVGDGKADDTGAIKQAIADASKTGGVVQLGKGKYRITDSLKIEADNVVMKGLGHDLTTIWADGKSFHAVVVGSDARKSLNVGISDLRVDRPERADAGVCNIFLAWAGATSVDNVSIANAGDGLFIGSRTAPDICGCVSITRVWMGLCRRCLVIATAADVTISHMYGGYTEVGVYLTGGANNIRLTDSLFLTMRPEQGKHGLVSDGGFMQEVKGCVFEETSEEVIKATGILRFFFHDNWLNANPDFPMIRLDKVAVFDVRNTRFGGSGTTCVELDHCSRGEVSGNHMESSRGIGIDLVGGDNIEITSNQMGGNWVKGLRISDGAKSVRAAGNHISGAECAIHLTPNAGDNLIIKDNFLTKGKRGYIIDESKSRKKVIKDNVEEAPDATGTH